MANNKDLTKYQKRFGTDIEPREAGRKAGIASGKSRRKKRAMRETAQIILSMDTPENIKKQLKQFGMDEKSCPIEMSNQTALIARMVLKAIGGDARAAEFIRDTAGFNLDTIERQEQTRLAKKQFKYQKKKDRGMASETEDLSGIEEEIYGEEADGEPEGGEAEEIPEEEGEDAEEDGIAPETEDD